jgi:hypothetical protein
MITQQQGHTDTERDPQSKQRTTWRNTPKWQRDDYQTSRQANRSPRWLDSNILPLCSEESQESCSTDMLFIRNVVETSIKVTSGNAFGTKQAERFDGSTSQHRRDSRQTWNRKDLLSSSSRGFVNRFDDEFSTSLNPLHKGRLRNTQAHSEHQEVNTRSPTAAQKKERKLVLFSAAADYGFAHEVACLRRSQEESQRRLLMQCIVNH